jgi:hypothetical protein
MLLAPTQANDTAANNFRARGAMTETGHEDLPSIDPAVELSGRERPEMNCEVPGATRPDSTRMDRFAAKTNARAKCWQR